MNRIARGNRIARATARLRLDRALARAGRVASALFLVAVSVAPGLAAQKATDAAPAAAAPDGRPGFGQEATVKDLRGMFQSPSEEQRAFLESLNSLETGIRVLQARFAKSYEKAGYEKLLASGVEPTLDNLHAAWFAGRAEPLVALSEPRGRDRAFGQVAADVRFRVRAVLLAEVEHEIDELNGALDLMRAHFDGYADLTDPEFGQLGLRADIAASVLRTLSLDLDTLRDDEPPDREALAAFEDLGAGGARGREAQERTRAALARLDANEERVFGALFTSRRSNDVQAAVDWRERQRGASLRVLEKARVLSPVVTPEKDAPPDVADLGKSKRHEYTVRTAMEGLSYDLLNEELYFLAGESSDFQWGGLESRRWYDRFLALRGIRGHDHRSYDVKTLDKRERQALERVQAPVVVPR